VLFNSLGYLFVFLPVTLAGYFGLHRYVGARAAVAWLTLASMIFYGLWKLEFLPILVASIAANHAFGHIIRRARSRSDRHVRIALSVAITANLALLGYYKYADFFIANINAALGMELAFLRLALPLGISFFTFTQIAFLVDTARGSASEHDPLRYTLFVTFFPHLLAGPILHHREMMPQFADLTKATPSAYALTCGVTLIILGLAKKVLIADPLSPIVQSGFSAPGSLGCLAAWTVALAYTFQLYFDFSGYCDMAVGASLLFNIQLPLNFASPYRALDLQDFWRRWHITLSRFLRDYLYIPLGGNRKGFNRGIIATIVTFTLGGFWHGANWTYIVWGLVNDLATPRHAPSCPGRLGHHIWFLRDFVGDLSRRHLERCRAFTAGDGRGQHRASVRPIESTGAQRCAYGV
jgi:alginate O-acetyltransferase complex protein AlgI